MHYRQMLDPGIFFGPQDFAVEKTVNISRVIREDLPAREGEAKTAAPMLYFSKDGKEHPKKYKVPKSVMYGLSCAFGTETDTWIGKDVTLFAAKCLSFGEIEECVRIKFSQEVEVKISKWMKKRRANTNSYILKETK